MVRQQGKWQVFLQNKVEKSDMGLKYIWQRCFMKLHGVATKNVSIHRTSKIGAGSTVINSVFDRYSFCGYNCKIIGAKIGAFCSIADGVIIGVAEHPTNWVSSSPVFYAGRDSVKVKFSEFSRETHKETIIGNDVWIGERAMIKAGVLIGTGAVIGMGAVVTKNVLPYEVIGGIPAKHIRFRFHEEVIKKLMSSQWWDLEESSLRKFAQNIRNPEVFLEEMAR